jgi:hypothetical protein
MSDVVTTARNAREALAKGLNALQSDPNSPAEFLSAAEPIAIAMGALHRIERSAGAEIVKEAPAALDAVRRALSLLQTKATSDPRLMVVMESVAGSLGQVFALTKAASYGPPPQPAQPMQQGAAAGPMPVQAAAAQMPVAQAAAPPPWAQQPAARPAMPAQPVQPQYPAQPYPAQPAQPYPVQPAVAQPVQPGGWGQAQAAAPQAFAATQLAAAQPAQPAAVPQQAVQRPAADDPKIARLPAAYRGQENLPTVEAELGTHSASNFYKGLSGNDIIDFGGLFVATYNIPKIGQTLRVHVSLPGGYEFEAIGVVRWTREARESVTSDIAPPGYGLQFTTISPEARNLVYRYVRNREPLFHDDL